MTDVNVDKIKKLLTDKGYHWTRPRYELFKLLFESGPMSIKEIILKSEGKADRVSIYRNLTLFESLGVTHRINIGWKYKVELSDQFIAHHHHLSCLECGRIIDIEDEKHIDSFVAQVAKRFNFSPSRHQFDIEGLCQDCQLKQQPAGV